MKQPKVFSAVTIHFSNNVRHWHGLWTVRCGLPPSNIRPVGHFDLCRARDHVDISRPLYFLVVKSISLLELPPAEPALSQVQAPADLRPHAHEAPEAGLTFSVAALSQEHWRAGFAPQEQVAFWAVCGGGECQPR